MKEISLLNIHRELFPDRQLYLVERIPGQRPEFATVLERLQKEKLVVWIQETADYHGIYAQIRRYKDRNSGQCTRSFRSRTISPSLTCLVAETSGEDATFKNFRNRVRDILDPYFKDEGGFKFGKDFAIKESRHQPKTTERLPSSDKDLHDFRRPRSSRD